MATIDQHGYIRPGQRPKHTKKKQPQTNRCAPGRQRRPGTCPVGRVSKLQLLQKSSKSRFPLNPGGFFRVKRKSWTPG